MVMVVMVVRGGVVMVGVWGLHALPAASLAASQRGGGDQWRSV